MYPIILNRSKPVPTLLSFLDLIAFSLLFSAQFSYSSGRNVHNHLLYPAFDPNSGSPSLDEWAGVQGVWESIHSDLKATPSRHHVAPRPSGSPTHNVLPPYSVPTLAPILNQLYRRDTFTSNVCPISIQTTVYISVDGTSSTTLYSTVGPRPTGIPGDTGMSTGTDPTGGRSGTGNQGGQSFGDKEGLITGLIIVLLILLASFCALCTYFYKKRRNARIQRLSAQPHSDAANIVRRIGSRGLLGLSNSDRGSRQWKNVLRWSPVAFFKRSFDRLKSSRRSGDRDSQSSELLERKRYMEQTDGAWSVAEDIPAEPKGKEKALPAQPSSNSRTSGTSIPEIISSPALSSFKPPSPPQPPVRPYTGNPSPVDYVPLVKRRVSPYRSGERLSTLRPLSTDLPPKSPSILDLHRETSPRRNSRGEPLSPSAWMAGFGLASGSNVDPFTNPSYGSTTDHHDSFGSHSLSKLSEPGSPLSNAPSSSASDQTPRGRQTSPQRIQNDRLSTVAEPTDVTGDGASDIISTFGSAFGDRPASHHTVSTIDEPGHFSSTQLARYHALSDVEEVLTPVADERLSIQPGSAFFSWRQHRDSAGGQSSNRSQSPSPRATEQPNQFTNPFADNNAIYAFPPPPSARGRRPMTTRRKSEVTSLSGGVLPSEKSGSLSLTGTSIVDHGPPIDTGDWDDVTARREEEDQLFYTRPDTAASGASSTAR